jgi:hypothetical protein
VPPPLLEWIMVSEPGSGGKHRLHVGPPGGVIAAAGAVLLATAASPAPVPTAAPATPQPAGGPPVPTHDEQITWSAAGNQVPTRPTPPSPPAGLADVSTVDNAQPVIPTVFTGDIPTTVLDAYRRARDATNLAQPGCHIPLELLAAIGKVETNHARSGRVDTHGTTLTPILGPVLNGNVFAAIPDTDNASLDGDPTWDRAVGPMQFIPGTWKGWAADGNNDHRADPHNVYDASLAAARYLCAANRDLGTPQGLDEAIYSYNHSTSYRNLVLSWMNTYRNGTIVIPDAPITEPTVAIAAPQPPPVTTVPPSTTTPTTTPPTTTIPPPTSTTPPPTTTEPPPTSTTPPPTSTVPPPTTTEPPPTTTAPPPPPPSEPPPPTTETPPPTTTSPGLVQGLVCTVTGLLGSGCP